MISLVEADPGFVRTARFPFGMWFAWNPGGCLGLKRGTKIL